MKKVTPFGIWDYDVSHLDLSDPEAARWYLARKIDVNDWGAIDYNLLKRHINKLDIDPDKKALLKNFIKWHDSHRTSKKAA